MKDADEPRQLEPLVTEPGKAEDAIEPNVTEPTPECRRCRFWKGKGYHTDNTRYRRICRRFPPVVAGDEYRGIQLSTFATDWCGEFQVRPKDTKQV